MALPKLIRRFQLRVITLDVPMNLNQLLWLGLESGNELLRLML